MINTIQKELNNSKRPVFLIGDGVRLSGAIEEFKNLVLNSSVPVLSSRFSQDIYSGYKNYFGFIGSHGTRYSNYILSKSDLIISLGNRLQFNKDSLTFKPIFQKKFICVDVNKKENIYPNWINIKADLKEFLPKLNLTFKDTQWFDFCVSVKNRLKEIDINNGIRKIVKILKEAEFDTIFTCDVGNNQLLLSYAYEYSGVNNRLIYSKSFGALGCSLPKAIGAYWAYKKPVICFSGDQGLMFNIQELQYLKEHKIPIKVVLLNNNASGMILDVEMRKYDFPLQTTPLDGYSAIDFKKIFKAFNLDNLEIIDITNEKLPYLPFGNECWDFVTG